MIACLRMLRLFLGQQNQYSNIYLLRIAGSFKYKAKDSYHKSKNKVLYDSSFYQIIIMHANISKLKV